jgi:hypothetical protein
MLGETQPRRSPKGKMYNDLIERAETSEKLTKLLREDFSDMAVIEEIVPIALKKQNDRFGIHLILDKDLALRSYIVYDFKPAGGMLVRDGGLWLTYDIQSFVDNILKEGACHNWCKGVYIVNHRWLRLTQIGK